MAQGNAIYPLYKQNLLAAGANVALDQNNTTDGPYAALIDAGVYTYNATDQYYSTAVGGLIGTEQRITTPTVVTGTFDGDNLTYSAVTGNSVETILIYRHNSGANTTWRLVCFLDTSVTGLPVTPNGGDITITWNGSGIFTL